MPIGMSKNAMQNSSGFLTTPQIAFSQGGDPYGFPVLTAEGDQFQSFVDAFESYVSAVTGDNGITPSQTFMNETGTTGLNVNSSYRYHGFGIDENGLAIAFPGDQPQMLKLNTDTMEFSTMDHPTTSFTNTTSYWGGGFRQWNNAVYAPSNGCFYGVPDYAYRNIKYNPSSDTFTDWDVPNQSNLSLYSRGLYFEGFIWCFSSSRLMKIDTSDDSTTVVSRSGLNYQWVIGPERCFYAATNTAILKYNPSTDTIETLVTGFTAGGDGEVTKLQLAANGKFYGISRSANSTYTDGPYNIVEFDPYAETVNLVGLTSDSDNTRWKRPSVQSGYTGMVTLPDGRIAITMGYDCSTYNGSSWVGGDRGPMIFNPYTGKFEARNYLSVGPAQWGNHLKPIIGKKGHLIPTPHRTPNNASGYGFNYYFDEAPIAPPSRLFASPFMS